MKSYFHVPLLAPLTAAAFTFSVAAFAEEKPTINGLSDVFAGTFQCALGTMGMSLQLHDTGPLPRDCDPDCAEASFTHAIDGIVHFFPTVSNPNAPEGAFTARGTVGYSYAAGKTMATIAMEPGEWIMQPENFGVSGLKLSIFFDGRTVLNMSGSPTAEGCHDMMLFPVPNM